MTLDYPDQSSLESEIISLIRQTGYKINDLKYSMPINQYTLNFLQQLKRDMEHASRANRF